MCLHPVLGTTDIFLEQRVSYHGPVHQGRSNDEEKRLQSGVFVDFSYTSFISRYLCI